MGRKVSKKDSKAQLFDIPRLSSTKTISDDEKYFTVYSDLL